MQRCKLLICCLLFIFSLTHAHAVTVLGALERFANLAPGDKYEGRILLNNKEDKPVLVKIYQSDYRCNSKGENYFDEPGTSERSNAKWIDCGAERLEVGANSTGVVNFSVKVPEKPGKTGLFWSMILIEPMLADDPELTVPTQTGMKIRTVTRFAVHILTTVGEIPDSVEGFKFLDHQISKINNRKYFEIDAENNSNYYMRPNLWAEFFDSTGKSIGRFPGGGPQLLPGCSVKYNVDVTDLPVGDYNVLVVADTGQSNVIGARYKVKID